MFIVKLTYDSDLRYYDSASESYLKKAWHSSPDILKLDVHCKSEVTLALLQPFNGLFSRTTWVSRYQKGKTNLDFTGARDSEW